MFNLKHGLIICCVLYCSIQIIDSRKISLETREKINQLVGEKQIALRNYLEGVKMETRKIDNDVRTTIKNAEESNKKEIDNIVDQIQRNTEIKSENPECNEQIDQSTISLMIKSVNVHYNCVSATKPSLANLFKDIPIHARFQMRIGVTPKLCILSNDDEKSILNCVEETMKDIGNEMSNSERLLNSKIQHFEKEVSNMAILLDDCEREELSLLKKNAEEIISTFDSCIKS